jgi:enoyl-CoA hydratase/carnithine racemase
MTHMVLKQQQGGVVLLTLNRPEKKNALNNAMWRELQAAFEQASADDSVAVLLLTGAGKDFCAGVDLADFANADGEHPYASCARVIAAFDKPWVCAARGIAIGGGATILFHADMVYVGESLRLRLPFVNLGLVPEFASSYTLQANIGARRAAELMYTADWIDAARALDVGIATAVCADETLLDTALERAQTVAQWPVSALRETKRCLKAVHQAGIEAAFKVEDEGMARQAGSPENIEAVMAFIEKRKPDFSQLG